MSRLEGRFLQGVVALCLVGLGLWGAVTVARESNQFTPLFAGQVAVSAGIAVVYAALLTGLLAWGHLRRGTAATALLCGAFVAVILAAQIEASSLSAADAAVPVLRGGWDVAVVDPPVEEICKLLCVIALVFLFRDVLGSGVRLMALGAVVGAGFQVVETYLDALGGAFTASTQGGNAWIGMGFQWLARSVELGVWLHPADTAIAAAGLATAIAGSRGRAGRMRAQAAGLILLAIALHVYWDTPFLRGPGRITDVVFGALPRAVSGIVAGWLVYRWMRDRDRADGAETAPAVTWGSA